LDKEGFGQSRESMMCVTTKLVAETLSWRINVNITLSDSLLNTLYYWLKFIANYNLVDVILFNEIH